MTMTMLSSNLSMALTPFLILCAISTNVNGNDVSPPKLHRHDVRDLRNTGYDVVLNEYIIEFHDSTINATSAVEEILTGTGAKIDHVFEHVFDGAIISNVPKQHLSSILDSPLIKHAEQVGGITLKFC